MNDLIVLTVFSTLAATFMVGEGMPMDEGMKTKWNELKTKICSAPKEKQVKAEKCCMIIEYLVSKDIESYKF